MPSVALVVFDTLRNDAFERYFDWLPGLRFTNAWSPSHWTTPVHGSLFTGTYPSEHGVHAKSQRFDTSLQVLTEVLRESGFTTRAFSSNPRVSRAFGFDRGFDEFDGGVKLGHLRPEVFDWGAFIEETRDAGPSRYLDAVRRCIVGDCDTVASLKQGIGMKLDELGYLYSDSGGTEALHTIRRTEFGEDEFFYLNLMESHAPYYEIPDEHCTDPDADIPRSLGFRETMTGIDAKPVRTAYDDAANYLSTLYRDVFEELTSNFEYVISVSDHGEMLGEHGVWGHEWGLYPQLTHVPLVVSDGTGQRRECDEMVSLLDVHRTVLDIAGIDAPSRGCSLLEDDIPPHETLTEYHGVTTQRIRSLDSDGFDVEPFDVQLRGIALPPSYYGHETPEGWRGDESDSGLDARDRLETAVESLDICDPAGGDDELDENVVQRLRDLGYA